MGRITTLALIFGVLLSNLWSEISIRVEVPSPSFSGGKFATQLPVRQSPDEPMIPYIPVRVLLPQGEKFQELVVDRGGSTKELSNITIPLFGKQAPISGPYYQGDQLEIDSYPLKGTYPGEYYREFGLQRKMGYDILIINLYPYQYNIETKTLSYCENIDLYILTVPDEEFAAEQNRLLVTSEKAQGDIRRLVSNPEMVDTYHKYPVTLGGILPDPTQPYSMVVITDAIRAPYFADYIEWKNETGNSTAIFLTGDIYSSYPGTDNQEKIRNFIIDANETFSTTDTPLQYVLLGGDDSIVPVRGMYCFVSGLWNNYEDYRIPSDVYYSNLDGNWDENGNGIYGELDDGIDWFAEVAVGRIPAMSEQDFYNFFQKNMHYATSPSYSNDIAIMIGESLDAITWGGDYKDEIIPLMPEDFHIQTFYERDGTYDNIGIREAVWNGLGILNHLGHSNENTVFGMTNYQVNQLNNTEFGLAYSQGCYTAAFDYTTTQDSEAIGQRLVNASGGFFAFIGNTRYGWYWPGSTEGASQLFDLTFFEGLFEQDIRNIGKTLNYSKETLVNEAMENNFQHHLWQNGFMLWTFYNQILFGDPSAYLRSANGTFPYLEPFSITYDDYLGDGDGLLNPGETVRIYLELLNREFWADALDVSVQITNIAPELELNISESAYPCIPSGDTATNITPFIVTLSYDIPYGDYKFTVSVTAAGDDEQLFRKDYELTLPVSIKQKYWPWTATAPIQGVPIIYEDGPQFTQIIAVDALSNIDFLDFRAEKVIPTSGYSAVMMKSAAMGDLFNDYNPILVVNNRSGSIIGFDLQGYEVFSYSSGTQFLNTPVLADITGDGYLEVLSHGIDRKLYVLSNEGLILDGFPIQLEQNILVELAAGDISGNGMAEVVCGFSSGLLDVIDRDGLSLEGFPINLGSPINLSPIILDNRNIVTGTQNNRLLLISPAGTILWELEFDSRAISEPVAADFNGDGELDLALLTANGKVYIINQSADVLEGFPIVTGEIISQPPLALDLNNNGSVDLIFATNSANIYGYSSEGNLLEMLPAPIGLQPASPLFVADIDRDGDFEIGYGTSLGISMIDYKIFGGELTPWSVYRGNLMRTGNYNDNRVIKINHYLPEPPQTELRQNYPNPFNITTKIPYYLNEAGTLKMSIYNIKGQEIRQLRNTYTPKGEGEIIWDGKNNDGRIVASGIYFTRMTLGKTTQVRKMLLLK